MKSIKSQNKILSCWVLENYGLRCLDYDKNCPVCEAWNLFDKLKLSDVGKQLNK